MMQKNKLLTYRNNTRALLWLVLYLSSGAGYLYWASTLALVPASVFPLFAFDISRVCTVGPDELCHKLIGVNAD